MTRARDLSREAALGLDAADPLAGFRARFAHRDPELVYVDGNSLGRPPLAAADALAAVAEDWAERLVGGWEDWIGLPVELGDRIGEALLGARPGEVVVCDSVTVNLFKLAGSALAARPGGVVLCDPDEFPTDRYVLAGLGREVVDCAPTPEAVAAAAAGREVALAVFSLVDYRSGARADLHGVTDAVHAAGGLMLWDLSHAVGSVAIDLDAAGADLATGCTYKYVAGGPGAPAFLYVRGELLPDLPPPPLQGWFGADDQFAMGPVYAPAPSIARFMAGTPPIVSMSGIGPGVDLLAEAGMEAVEGKGAQLTALAIDLADAWLVPLGFAVGTPRAPGARGAHVALRHPEAWRICRALIERAKVVPDFRRPDVVRLGFPALSTSFADVWDACDRLRALVAAGEHEQVDAGLRRVT